MNLEKKIYLDNAATTSVDKKVFEEMKPYFSEKYGNSSSLHYFGREAKKALEDSRNIIKKKLNAINYKIIFTSGGSESNNFAIKGLAEKYPNKKHIITTKIEHDCILNTCKYLEKKGYTITYLKVNKNGYIDLEELEEKINNNTLLVSIIHANNEIGTIQDIEKISEICSKRKVFFHTDACQSFCKIPIDLQKTKIDLLTINSHKIYGPKGVGALVIKDNINISPLIYGGGHEFGLRSGTVNIPGIVGFAKATEIITNKDIEHMKLLKDKLAEGILEIKDCWINGDQKKGLCNILNISFKGAEGEAIILHLDNKDICASTGSACSSNTLQASHVLLAIGLKKEDTNGAIRFSIGKDNTIEEINYVIEQTKNIINLLRKMNPYNYK